jgi:hypothetical protein
LRTLRHARGTGMRQAATIAGFLLIVGGLFGVAWPFPSFTLNEPYLSQYQHLIDWVFGVPDNDGTLGTAFVFMWLFLTMPVGLLAMCCGVPLLRWGRRSE